MKTPILAATLLAVSVIGAAARIHGAENEPVRVLSSNGVQAAVNDLMGPAQTAIGHPLSLHFGTTVVHKKSIEAGDAFDVTILTAEAIDALIKEGKIASNSRTDIGHAGIGVGIRAGAKKPDIGTPDAIKQTLLNAKAVTYASDGASKPHIEAMFAALGITQQMKPKLVLVQGSDASLNAVESGKADIILTLMSEIMPVKGVQLIGPLPEKFQSYINFAAGVSAVSKDPNAANALIKFLAGPKARPTFKAKGIEPGK